MTTSFNALKSKMNPLHFNRINRRHLRFNFENVLHYMTLLMLYIILYASERKLEPKTDRVGTRKKNLLEYNTCYY